ncbi:CDP-alcohol phosphatidyltransferase family protein [Nocardioides taihuensis]|uniref:CDP-alcohol phosphatidyltransferase family protein n=1 Tax=Nocardioides taihuensis TaxID=1835606 RepID=A0ABW0BJP6_9ACTN
MVEVRNGVGACVAALVILLGLLDARLGLGPAAWATGLGCGAVLATGVVRSATARRVDLLGPADVVTLVRGTLACAVAALVAASYGDSSATGALVALAAVALALDAVDGRVARRTGTVSAFGARLDGEADAFLMLVLSIDVARWAGPWVLVIGGVRYAFLVAGHVWPWLRGSVPPRYWRKVVAACSGVALLVAAAQLLPPALSCAGLAVAVVLLAESFGSEAWWLWRHRAPAAQPGERQEGWARSPG